MKPIQSESHVAGNAPLGKGTYRLVLREPAVAERVRPGQFVMLRSLHPGFPLMNRPFSVHNTQKSRKGEWRDLEILYRVVGRGTELLSRLTSGDKVLVLGPFGNGFSVGGRWDTAVLVAGGMGIAPFPLLVKKLRERKGTKRMILLYGVKRGAERIPLNVFACRGMETITAGEDGSGDFKGLVTDRLENVLRERELKGRRTRMFACGPDAMLARAGAEAAKFDIPCQVALEAGMACGFGVCLACVRRMRGEGGAPVYKRVCKDGPVFEAAEVLF